MAVAQQLGEGFIHFRGECWEAQYRCGDSYELGTSPDVLGEADLTRLPVYERSFVEFIIGCKVE